ncbi:lysophosphatidylcholine acyltransferase 1 isoform X1 [Lates japonicus]|uniref:Lysophosphatidylcholine acyltransferase 1 isoform X1 n=1 Tax=Lates japonicus TaxID=270547 RepID=A0AAD3NAR2_LATJO|nr:lysophosphatidylcholine acyltransferase 1 isoform X1 [Lates japonicus]
MSCGRQAGFEDFASSSNLPVTDTRCTQPLDQHGDGQIDIRHFIAHTSLLFADLLSDETLQTGMLQREEAGDILGEDLTTILEIMLGVRDVELSGLFYLDRPDKEIIW